MHNHKECCEAMDALAAAIIAGDRPAIWAAYARCLKCCHDCCQHNVNDEGMHAASPQQEAELHAAYDRVREACAPKAGVDGAKLDALKEIATFLLPLILSLINKK